MISRLRKDYLFYSGLLRTLRYLRPINSEKDDGLFATDVEKAVEKYPDNVAIIFEEQQWTYRQFDTYADRYTYWAISQNLKAGDCVALYMENCADYVACWYGLSKIGVITALINNHITGAALEHSIKTVSASHLIVDAQLSDQFRSIAIDLPEQLKKWSLFGGVIGCVPLEDRLSKKPASMPGIAHLREGLNGASTSLYMFTSGTTGLPKAATVTNRRTRSFARGFAGFTNIKSDDVTYIALPLYHATAGQAALGGTLISGGTIVLKRQFSVSEFWSDVTTFDCTIISYIGEMIRYINNFTGDVPRHSIRVMTGNGLRRDVWEAFQNKAKIPHIIECYGSTEGNASLVNFDGTLGAVGRYPKFLKKLSNLRIVKFDQSTDDLVKDAEGHCIEVGVDEPGELIAQIDKSQARFTYGGYKGYSSGQDKKLLKNPFGQDDSWFRTGDLLRQDCNGYYYFVDRLGDTFRWKGENVSTLEVADIIGALPYIDDAIVYGVPIKGREGKASMAALVCSDGLDLVDLHGHIYRNLPSYARPIFLRMLASVDITGTFKYKKKRLVAEAYTLSSGNDVILFDHPGSQSYVPLTNKMIHDIEIGAVRV